MNGNIMEYGAYYEGAIRDDEVLVPDSRARLRPAEMVERKLVSMLKSLPMPASQLQQAQLRRPTC